MKSYAFITGRCTELSIEELLRILEPLGYLVEVQRRFVIFQGDLDPTHVLSLVGGTIKVAEVMHVVKDWRVFSQDDWLHLLRSELSQQQHRFDFGLSVYSPDTELKRHLKSIGLNLKKHIQSLPLPTRFVCNREYSLPSVAVRNERLLNRELVVCEGQQYYFCITRAVQDFEAYAQRDYGRPSRNARRGMLPPKVAQIMLNLAEVTTEDRILDPFCGSGTIIQEALLRGLRDVWGSDSDLKAIASTRENMKWLAGHYNIATPRLTTANIFELVKHYDAHFFTAVITEPYLGPASILKRSSLTRKVFENIQAELDLLYRHLFEELAVVTEEGGRAVIIFPIFKLFNTEFFIGNLKRLENFGWKLIEPMIMRYLPHQELSSRNQLVYSREGQIVEREITVWKRVAA